MQEKRSAENVLYKLGWISIAIMIIGIVGLKVFPDFFSRWMIPCPFHIITGYYCPGCGGTRAVKYFLSGRILKSFSYHPLVPYLGIGGVIFMVTHTLERVTKGSVRGIRFRGVYVYLMGVILVVQFIVKNVLVYYGYSII